MYLWVIVLLSILIPIILLFAFFALFKYLYWRKFNKYLNELETLLSAEPFIETLTILKTIDIRLNDQEQSLNSKIVSFRNDQISNVNFQLDELKKNKEKFASQTLTIEEKIKNLKNLKNELSENLGRSKVFPCFSIIKMVELEKFKINEIKKNVNEESLKFINPIKEFLNKKIKYSNMFNNLSNKIEIWFQEIQNDTFEKNMNDRINKIQEYLGEAEQNNLNSQNEESIRLFTMFKKMLFELIVFDNYYENFKNILFSNERYSQIKNEILKKGLFLNVKLDNLNVNEYFKNIENELKLARENFYKLDISKTEKHISNYFNSIHGVIVISYKEFAARAFFQEYGLDNIRNYHKSINNKYNELKNMCEKVVYIDKLFYWNLETNLRDLEKLLKVIDENILKFTNIIHDDLISYISKLDQYKKIFLLMSSFINLCNELDSILNSFYTEGISQGLRYNKLKKIYISGLVNIKKFNVKLDKEDNELILKIESKKRIIEDNIFNKNNYDEKYLKKYVDELFDLLIRFITKTLKKVTIIKFFTLVNTEYSYHRIHNSNYDKKIIECEMLIQEGKYMEGLKKIIQHINEVRN